MGFDLYGMNAEAEEGDYYRANVWYWRPLWQYVTVACDDILTGRDMEKGEFNDGHKISKTKANRIASRLKKLDKNGSIMKYESEYKTYLRSLPKVDCNICEGTGVREDEIGREARKKDKEYKMFTNIIFNTEKEANDFGKKSMKRGFEHKIVEYNSENYERYWYK